MDDEAWTWPSTAQAIDAEGYDAVLYTAPEFGCVQFAARDGEQPAQYEYITSVRLAREWWSAEPEMHVPDMAAARDAFLPTAKAQMAQECGIDLAQFDVSVTEKADISTYPLYVVTLNARRHRVAQERADD